MFGLLNRGLLELSAILNVFSFYSGGLLRRQLSRGRSFLFDNSIATDTTTGQLAAFIDGQGLEFRPLMRSDCGNGVCNSIDVDFLISNDLRVQYYSLSNCRLLFLFF